MPQLLSVSRAARLVGTTRSILQRKIRSGEMQTFEGKIQVTDLLRIYPHISLEDNTMLEKVQKIKAEARPRRSYVDEGLPAPEILANRLTDLAKQLVCSRNELQHQRDLARQLLAQIENLLTTEPQLHTQLQSLHTLSQKMVNTYECKPNSKDQLLVKDAFLRIMVAHVKMVPSGHDFFVEGSSSLLESAIQSGLALNYGCTSGNCGACKARLISGEVWKINDHDYVLSESEKNMGYFLLCSHTAVTDLVIEAAEAHVAADIPKQVIRARVKKLEAVTDDILALYVQTPRNKTLRFMAGQYVNIEIGEHKIAKLQLALASCPCDGRNLQFHIHSRNPAWNIIRDLKIQQPIIIKGPEGDFVLVEDDPRPAIFIAYAHGFAPIKSLIEHAISIDLIENMYLFRADIGEHYLDNICRSWDDALDYFQYSAINSLKAEDLINLVLAECANLGEHNVYLAGPQHLVQTGEQLLLNAGLKAEQLRIASI
jgi:CDP-4-dehydro-6-deoxyglucose reductase, E3